MGLEESRKTMKLICKGAYHNTPAGLHFDAGVIEVDDWRAEFLLRDAPENFEKWSEPFATVEAKAFDKPPTDTQVKVPARKK